MLCYEQNKVEFKKKSRRITKVSSCLIFMEASKNIHVEDTETVCVTWRAPVDIPQQWDMVRPSGKIYRLQPSFGKLVGPTSK